MNYSIDSLNNVVSNERINIQNKTKEIEAFSKKDLSNQIEISMLKSEFNEANLKIPSPDSVTFFNFSNLLSVVEMDKLYKCLPPRLNFIRATNIIQNILTYLKLGSLLG